MPAYPTGSRRFQNFLVVTIVLIVIAAAAARFVTYDFSLPYIDHPDEPTLYLKAQSWRGLFDSARVDNANRYPPAVISVNYGVQILLEQAGYDGVSPTTAAMRVISVVVNLATLGLVMASAYLIGGLFAAAVTGLVWAASAVFLESGVYALADPWVYMLTVLALLLAFVAVVDKRRAAWVVWSGLAGLLAILFKYPAVAVLSVCGAALLLQLWRMPRLGRRYATIVALLAGLVAFYLLVIYRADRILVGSPDAETAPGGIASEARENGLRNLVALDRIWNNLYYALWPLGPVVFPVVGAFGLLAYLVAWRRGLPRINMTGVVLAGLVILSVPWVAAVFSEVAPDRRLRDVLPATHVATIVLGVAAAQVTYLVRNTKRRMVLQVGVLVLLAFAYRSEVQESWDLIEDRRLPDTRAEVRDWADAVLEPGTVLVDEDNAKTFNPYWGNSDAAKWFDWWQTRNPREHTVASWRQDYGISYALIPSGTQDQLAAIPEGQAFLDQLLLLREFGSPAHRGPNMALYRLWPMDVDEQVQFGDRILLLGYDRSTATVEPGGSVELRFYWRATATPRANYSLFVHLTQPADRTPIAQSDGAAGTASRPTRLWDIPSETIISDPFVLTVPADLEPGEYQIRIGLYDYETFVRLPVGEVGGDSFPLMTLTVTAPGSATP